jgi:hypothetical protein
MCYASLNIHSLLVSTTLSRPQIDYILSSTIVLVVIWEWLSQSRRDSQKKLPECTFAKSSLLLNIFTRTTLYLEILNQTMWFSMKTAMPCLLILVSLKKALEVNNSLNHSVALLLTSLLKCLKDRVILRALIGTFWESFFMR